MIMISDEQVAAAFTMGEAKEALRHAFTQFADGTGAILARGRASAELDGRIITISAMGAVLPGTDVLGAKVYSTVNGQFNFLVNLFSASTGAWLASVQANELTRMRTAAATALAAEIFVRGDAKTLAIFGAGVQAQAHVEAMLMQHTFTQVLVCARSQAAAFAASIAEKYQIDARAVDAITAASTADVIITCTRSNEALFDGNLVKAGCFVAAVGSSKPVAREIDDALLSRAARIVVEWLPAAKAEAGEFVQAAAGVLQEEKIMELGKVMVTNLARKQDDIVIYKSVGIGLEDIALAKFIFDKLA